MAMGMRDPAMPMLMGMSRGKANARVRVVVVAVVVAMTVDMLQRFMRVPVLVSVEEEKGDADEQERSCCGVSPEKGLSEKSERKRRAEEGRAGESDLSSRRSQMLGGEHVQHDARAVRESAQPERKEDVQPVSVEWLEPETDCEVRRSRDERLPRGGMSSPRRTLLAGVDAPKRSAASRARSRGCMSALHLRVR